VCRERQWDEINQDEMLRSYATTLQREMTQLLLALMTLDSGLVGRQPGIKEKTLNFGASVLGSVPFPASGLAGTLIKKAINVYNSKTQGSAVSSAVQEINSLDAIDEMAGGLARKLTVRYRDQIADLVSKSDAKRFAEAAIAIITEHIYSQRLNTEIPLNDELLNVVSNSGRTFGRQVVPDAFKAYYETQIKTQHIGEVLVKDLYTFPLIRSQIKYYGGESLTEARMGARSGTRNEAKALGMKSLGDVPPKLENSIPELPPLTPERPETAQLINDESKLKSVNSELYEVKQEVNELRTQVSALNRFWAQQQNQRQNRRWCNNCTIL
jgi:hypothetical protein